MSSINNSQDFAPNLVKQILKHIFLLSIFAALFVGVPIVISANPEAYYTPTAYFSFQAIVLFAYFMYEKLFVKEARWRDFLNAAIASIVLYVGIYIFAILPFTKLVFNEAYFSILGNNPIAIFFFVLIVGDSIYYLLHRAFHNRRLFHRSGHFVHHIGTRYFAFLGLINSAIEQPLYFLLDDVLLHSLGNLAAATIYLYFWTVWPMFIHCLSPTPSAPYHRLIVTPQFHHVHHRPGSLNTNFGRIFTLFDFLLGTAQLPETDAVEPSLPIGFKAMEAKYGVNWLRWSRENLKALWKR